AVQPGDADRELQFIRQQASEIFPVLRQLRQRQTPQRTVQRDQKKQAKGKQLHRRLENSIKSLQSKISRGAGFTGESAVQATPGLRGQTVWFRSSPRRTGSDCT